MASVAVTERSTFVRRRLSVFVLRAFCSRLSRKKCPILNFQSLLVTWCTNRFNIQQLYALPTLYLCVFYSSQNKQRLVPLTP